jgi:hypothetical protein
MAVNMYEKLVDLLSVAAPDIVKDHMVQLSSDNVLSLASNFFNSFEQNSRTPADFLSSINLLSSNLAVLGLEKIKLLIDEIAIDDKILDPIKSLITKSPQDFVNSFDVKSNPNNAYALLLITNIVDDKSMDLILSEILNQNLQSYFLESNLKEFFGYTLENFLERKNLNVTQAAFSEDRSKAQERKKEVGSTNVKQSPVEDLLKRIKKNQVSDLELNNALNVIPSLALKIATRFDDFGPEVKENLAKNILPKLENTPINNFCRDIIEAKMPRQITVDPKVTKDKSTSKFKSDKSDIELEVTKSLKLEVKKGRVSLEDSKLIENSVKELLSNQSAKEAKSLDKIPAAVAEKVEQESSLQNVRFVNAPDTKVSVPEKFKNNDELKKQEVIVKN